MMTTLTHGSPTIAPADDPPPHPDLRTLDATLRRTLPMARIEVKRLPGCESIALGLINADFPLGPLPPEVMHDVLATPPYWALCWGSGLALARLIASTPELVRGLDVVDLGAGSGVVAIAAKRFGARRVVACDTDPDARIATAVNARLNELDVDVVACLDDVGAGFDVLFMADVLYDRANLPLLDAARAVAPRLVVADSRIASLEVDGFAHFADLEARTFPNLGEFDEFRTVHFFRFGF
jgi:predicted nicotinamide N-methyase